MYLMKCVRRVLLFAVAITSSAAPAMAAPVQPTTISGLQLWLKADAGVYTTFSDDANFGNDTAATTTQTVAGWQDLSGNSRHALQTTSGQQPTLQTNGAGNSVIRFDGSNDWLQRSGIVLPTNDAAFTMLAVFAKADTGSVGGLFGQFNNSAVTSRAFAANGNSLAYDEYPGVGGPFLQTSGGISAGQIYIGNAQLNGANRSVSLLTDASNVSASGASETYTGGAPLLWAVGARYNDSNPANNTWHFNGDIAEIIIYDSALSVANLQNVNDYLLEKYFDVQFVPEPSSVALLLTGIAVLFGRGRRKYGN
jgi:hypothetical protein